MDGPVNENNNGYGTLFLSRFRCELEHPTPLRWDRGVGGSISGAAFVASVWFGRGAVFFPSFSSMGRVPGWPAFASLIYCETPTDFLFMLVMFLQQYTC